MKASVLGLVVSAVLFGLAWLYSNSSQVPSPNPPTQFSDTEYGFRLSFPPSWHGVRTLRVKTADYDYVAFTHPFLVGQDGREGKLEFSVFVMDRAQEQPPSGAVELSERDSRRYAWILSPTAIPPSLQAAASDLPGILSTFTTLGR